MHSNALKKMDVAETYNEQTIRLVAGSEESWESKRARIARQCEDACRSGSGLTVDMEAFLLRYSARVIGDFA